MINKQPTAKFNTNWWPQERWLQRLHLGLWLLFFGIHWAAFSEIMPIDLSLIRSLVNIGMLMLLFYACGQAFYKYYERKHYSYYAMAIICLLVLVSLLRYGFNIALPAEYAERPHYRPGPASFLFGVLVTNIICVLSSLMYESLLAKKRMEDVQIQLQVEQREAKLQFLKAQLNPHFLFNTLNNIYSLATVKSEKTAPLVLRLSELLQYLVYEGQQEIVSLKAEVQMLQEYLDMIQLQYEHTLAITYTQNVDQEDYHLPPLLLVPIIENCFKHGDFAENENANLSIKLFAQNGELSFVVSNTYNAEQQQKDRVGGVGLENIRRRLDLYASGENYLQVDANGRVFIVEMTVQLMSDFVAHPITKL